MASALWNSAPDFSIFFSSSRTFLSSWHSQRGTVRRRSPRASLVCEFVLENSLCSGLLAGTPSRSGSSLAHLLTNLICLFEVCLVQFRQWTISPSRVHKQRVRSGKLPCRLPKKGLTAGTAVLPNEGIRRRSVRVLATHVQFPGVVQYGSSRIHHRSLRFVSQVETLQSIIR